MVADEGEMENFLGWFIQQYRRPDGRRLIDCYLQARPHLPVEERNFLLGWRDVVEGIFEGMPVGAFLGTRVVPLGTEWLLSGATASFPADEHDRVLSVAAQMAVGHPELVFRNPARLARGWELQAEDRAAFVEHFGSDTVVIDSAELRPRLDGYAAERYGDSDVGRDRVSSIVENLNPDARSAGLIYDEVDGLGVYADYALAQEAFDEPSLVTQRPHRRLLKAYLDDDSAAFRWATHGENLLREHKPGWYAGPRLPRTSVVGNRLADHLPRWAAIPSPTCGSSCSTPRPNCSRSGVGWVSTGATRCGTGCCT